MSHGKRAMLQAVRGGTAENAEIRRGSLGAYHPGTGLTSLLPDGRVVLLRSDWYGWTRGKRLCVLCGQDPFF